MNIFALHNNPDRAAEMHCDKHVAKTFDSLPNIGLTLFAQAMPEYLQSNDAVKSYRNYYKTEKAHLLKFTKREDWTK